MPAVPVLRALLVTAALFAASVPVAPPAQAQAARSHADAPMPDFDLDDYRRSHRPLLLFAPAADHPALETLRRRLRDHAEAVRVRDVLPVYLYEHEPGRVGDDPISEETAAALRQRYNVEQDAFAAVLIGRDGGPKDRWDEPFEIDELAALIDAMPMGRREKQEREGGG